MTYAILPNPRHKRVYLNHANAMAVNELAFMKQRLSAPVTNIHTQDIGNLPYILFDAASQLTTADINLLSRLSFAYALFELANPQQSSSPIIPIATNPDYFIDEDISAILKYTGKTNELFTRLMLNLALSYQQTAGPIKLLDPMAGKGTTLYEGLMQNLDVYGIEIDPKPAHEAFVYIKKHFEMARYKHTSHTQKTGGIAQDGKKFSATRYQVDVARSKEEQKANNSRKFEIIAGDTRHTASYHKKDFFHIILADLPYGVQHHAKKKPHSGGLTRNALELVTEAMPGWMKVLKHGGVIALAWNLFLIDRGEMVKLFADHGLVVPDNMEEMDFSHRLDQATHRDLIIGVRRNV